MVNEEVVEGVMRSALTSISKKDKISLKELRIKMQLNETKSSVECAVMVGTEHIGELTWARILGLKVVFANVVIETIKTSLLRISNEHDIHSHEINARIYAVDEHGTPNIYVYNGKKPYRRIELSEILK